MTNCDVHYDFGADMLSVRKEGQQIKKSLSFGDVRVEFGRSGSVIGLEVMNASSHILVDEGQDVQTLLQKMNDATIHEKQTENGFMVVIRLYEDEAKEKQLGMMQQSGPAVTA